MGVHGLWDLLSPSANMVSVDVLHGKRLAVDISIWFHQLVHGIQVRDIKSIVSDELSNNWNDLSTTAQHRLCLITLFHRLCKLLFNGIKPVIVFDGKTPMIKRQTVRRRQQLRRKQEIKLQKVAKKMLQTKLERYALDQAMNLIPSRNISREKLNNVFYSQKSNTESDEIDIEKVSFAIEEKKEDSLPHLPSPIKTGKNNSLEESDENMLDVGDDFEDCIGTGKANISFDSYSYNSQRSNNSTSSFKSLISLDSSQLSNITKDSLSLDETSEINDEEETKKETNEQEYGGGFVRDEEESQDTKNSSKKVTKNGLQKTKNIVEFVNRLGDLNPSEGDSPKKNMSDIFYDERNWNFEDGKNKKKENEQEEYTSVFDIVSPQKTKAKQMIKSFQLKDGGFNIKNIDIQTFKELPLPIQEEVLKEMRRARRWKTVDTIMQMQQQQPSQFSNTQLKHFLETRKASNKLRELVNDNKGISGNVVSTGHMASNPDMRYVLTETEKKSKIKSEDQGVFQNDSNIKLIDISEESTSNNIYNTTQDHNPFENILDSLIETASDNLSLNISIDNSQIHEDEEFPIEDELEVHNEKKDKGKKSMNVDNEESDEEEWEKVEDDKSPKESSVPGKEVLKFLTNEQLAILGGFQVEERNQEEPRDNSQEVKTISLEEETDGENSNQNGSIIKPIDMEKDVEDEQIKNNTLDKPKERLNKIDIHEEDSITKEKILINKPNQKIESKIEDIRKNESIQVVDEDTSDDEFESIIGTHTNTKKEEPAKNEQQKKKLTVRFLELSDSEEEQIEDEKHIMDKSEVSIEANHKENEDDSILAKRLSRVSGRDLAQSLEQLQSKHSSTSSKQLDQQYELEKERIKLYEKQLDLQQQQKETMQKIGGISKALIDDTKILLQIMGIPYVQSPYEADSQCGFLCKKNLVDGIITEDSDVFLFGASNVYRNFFSNEKQIEEFSAEEIKEQLGIRKHQLIELALFLGSDYTPGVHNIGIVTAIQIIDAFSNLSEEEIEKLSDEDVVENMVKCLKEFKEWVHDTKTIYRKPKLTTDREGYFKYKFNKMKKHYYLPKDFPSERVVKEYLFPRVDNSEEAFQWGKPHRGSLIQFASSKIGWDEEKVDKYLNPILEKLKSRNQNTIETYFTKKRLAKINSKRILDAVSSLTKKAKKEKKSNKDEKKEKQEDKDNIKDETGGWSSFEDEEQRGSIKNKILSKNKRKRNKEMENKKKRNNEPKTKKTKK